MENNTGNFNNERGSFRAIKISKRVNLQFAKSCMIIAAAILASDYLIESIAIKDIFSFCALVLCIWALNFILRPLIILFTLPFVLFTLGAGIVLADAVVVWVASGISLNIQLGTFWNALIIGAMIEFLSWCFVLFESSKLERNAKNIKDDDSNKNDVIDV